MIICPRSYRQKPNTGLLIVSYGSLLPLWSTLVANKMGGWQLTTEENQCGQLARVKPLSLLIGVLPFTAWIWAYPCLLILLYQLKSAIRTPSIWPAYNIGISTGAIVLPGQRQHPGLFLLETRNPNRPQKATLHICLQNTGQYYLRLGDNLTENSRNHQITHLMSWVMIYLNT